jgi:hypothetical protein
MDISMVFEITFLGSAFLGLLAVPLCRYFIEVARYKPPGKIVGPSYWGSYVAHKEEPWMRTIKLRKISFAEIITAGSSVYSKGKPVKSLRR